MKALTLTGSSQFTFGDAPEPEIRDDEILVKVAACGICGSDVHGMDGSTGRRIPPVIMGHEAAGIVVRSGANAGAWQQGERVTFDSTLYCGSCAYCMEGQVNLCKNRRILGVSCADYRQHGAFAEYVSVPGRVVCRLPAGVTFEQAVFVEPAAVAIHAVRRAQAGPGQSALVVGAGIIGLLTLQALKAAGCEQVFATDLSEGRLALARELGADGTFPAKAGGVKESILALTGGEGVDVAMECVGVTAAVQTAIDCVRKGGMVGLVGNLAQRIDFPLQSVVTREISLFGSCASAGEYPAALEEIAAGRIRVEPLTSAIRPLEEGAEWFHKLHAAEGDLIKVILKP
ncbi:MAG TPA: galactitol-1-phosphate 5-dehydrogenase [Verrucomicrobiales bacterium]|jgi:L-iditol 2-dehydrogenase|nr:galactitol-1-phosphate 5-dehydrogenase [Verrucomicrobiales bacterium]